MANYQNLLDSIANVITTNNNNEITGAIMKSTLQSMVSVLGENATFGGVAETTDNPGTPDGSVVFFASASGTYTNFGGLVVNTNELALLIWDGSTQTWSKETITTPQVIDNLTTNDATNSLSAKQGKLIADTTMKYVESANILDPDTITANGKVIRKDTGAEYTVSGCYGHTGLIPLDSDGLICNSSLKASGVVSGCVCYDSSKALIANLQKSPGSNGGSVSITPTGNYANVAYVVFNLYTNSDGEYAVYKGTTLPDDYVAYFEPYYTTKDVTCDSVPTEDSTLPVASGGVYPIKQSVDTITQRTLVEPKNWLDMSELETGVYYAGNSKYTSSSYNASGFIPVEVGETYIYVYGAQSYHPQNIRFLNGYDSDKNYVSGSYKENITSYTVPSGVSYVRISCSSTYFIASKTPMFYTGERTNLYSAYFEPYYRIGTIENKFQYGKEFARLNYSGSVGSSETKTTDICYIVKQYALTCEFTSNFTDINIGINNGSVYGRWYNITSSNFVIYTSGGVVSTQSHGLTIGSHTIFMLTKDTSSTSATIRLVDDDGNIFTLSDEVRVVCGAAFVTNNGSSSIDVNLSFFPRQITSDIWIFGDSYLSYLDTARWMYYPINWGFDNFLLNARGGETSAESLTNLQNLLATGIRPSYLVWCLGMNDGADETNYNQPSFAWKDNLNIVLDLCDQYGITPILATIPTIPGASHALLNTWVRNSGYRYIDFASAVEESGTDYWKNYGDSDAMLSSDLVHPTSYGAKALAMQALADFPEMTIK